MLCTGYPVYALCMMYYEPVLYEIHVQYTLTSPLKGPGQIGISTLDPR